MYLKSVGRRLRKLVSGERRWRRKTDLYRINDFTAHQGEA
jgi:hypothetical protein